MSGGKSPGAESLPRWFMLLIFFMLLALPLLLPPPASTLIFITVIVGLPLIIWLTRSDAIRRWRTRRYINQRTRITLRDLVQPPAPHLDIKRAFPAIVALLAMCAAAYGFRPGHTDDAPLALVAFLGGCGLLIVTGLARKPATHTPHTHTLHRPATTHKHTPYRWIGALVCLITLSAINVLAPAQVPTLLQFGLLLIGVWLLAYPALTPVQPWHATPRHSIAILIILLAAFGLRVANLEYEIHRHIDEIASVESLLGLSDDPDTALLRPFEGVAAFTRTYSVLQSFTVAGWGPSLSGLRLLSAFFGTLTVAALYLLSRVLFDRKTALIAAALLATFPPHIHYSRIGINNIVDPLFGVLALAFIAQGAAMTRHNLAYVWSFLLAGVCLGLTQYWYEGGRLLFPALILTFALLHIKTITLRGWVALLTPALIVAAPVYITLLLGNFPLTPRLQGTTNPGYWRDLLAADGPVMMARVYGGEFVDRLWLYVQKLDRSAFYAGETALVLVYALPFFLLGCGVALAQTLTGRGRVRASHHWQSTAILIVWLLAVAAGNALLVNGRQSPRYVVAFPALMLLAALGVRYVATIIGTRRTIALLMITVVLAVYQVDYYFNLHTDVYMRQYAAQAGVEDVYFRAVRLPDNTHARLVTDTIVFGADAFLLMDFYNRAEDGVFVSLTHPNEMTQTELENLLPSRNHAFFIKPDEDALIALFDSISGWERRERSPFDVTPLADYVMFYRGR